MDKANSSSGSSECYRPLPYRPLPPTMSLSSSSTVSMLPMSPSSAGQCGVMSERGRGIAVDVAEPEMSTPWAMPEVDDGGGRGAETEAVSDVGLSLASATMTLGT